MFIRFTMISNAIFFLTSLLSVQCGLAASVGSEISPIPLSEIVSTFNRTHHDTVDFHLMFMLFVASYGDHLYNLPVNFSAECQRTARVNTLMMQKLAVGEEAFNVMGKAVDSTSRDLQKRTKLTEHPLEPLCRRIEEEFANSSFSSLFEKAKKDVANFTNVSPRPPYFNELLKHDDLMLKMVEKSDVPELARVMAALIFRQVLRGNRRRMPEAWTIFARSCKAVAKKEKFADSMQSIFEKTIDDVLPEIMVPDRVEKYISTRGNYKPTETPPTFWVHSMTRIMYGHIAKDSTLKKEVDDMVRTVDDARREYWDFSKPCFY